MNLKEYQERWDRLQAISGIPERPKGGRRLPKTPATGGTQYGVIMIPRSWHGPKSTRSNRIEASSGKANLNGRRNGRPSFRDERDNTL